jgi:hypothetical protein
MYVKIGPYKEWWGPYQIANLIPFASEETRDKIGDWLADTWVSDLCERIHKIRGERDIKVRIDKYDTWSMDHTLAYIILPMLKQLQETKHGSQLVDDEDLPPYMRYGNPDGYDNWVHYRWEWVLNEMIFAFESKLDDSWEDRFYHGEPKYNWELVSKNEEEDSECYTVKQLNPDYWIDMDGYKLYNDRIQNGFRLFGKYYQGLWD